MLRCECDKISFYTFSSSLCFVWLRRFTKISFSGFFFSPSKVSLRKVRISHISSFLLRFEVTHNLVPKNMSKYFRVSIILNSISTFLAALYLRRDYDKRESWFVSGSVEFHFPFLSLIKRFSLWAFFNFLLITIAGWCEDRICFNQPSIRTLKFIEKKLHSNVNFRRGSFPLVSFAIFPSNSRWRKFPFISSRQEISSTYRATLILLSLASKIIQSFKIIVSKAIATFSSSISRQVGCRRRKAEAWIRRDGRNWDKFESGAFCFLINFSTFFDTFV